MKQIVALVSVLGFVAGMTGAFAAAESPVDSPAAVVESFVAKLTAIAPEYRELSGFKEYAASRKDKLQIRYEKGMTPLKTKRYVMPDDFADKGMLLIFDLYDDRLPSTPQATATTRHLKAFHLSLYADFQLSASPSPGLREELKKLIAEHVARLDKLNEGAANKSVEPTRAPEGARGSP